MNALMYRKKKTHKHLLFKKIIVLSFLSLGSIFVSCALFSFHAQDPSWFFFNSTNFIVANIFGFAGAHCAALLFFLFGSAALLLVPCSIFLTYLVALDKVKKELCRLMVLFALIFLSSTIESIYHSTVFLNGFVPGGFFGSFLQAALLKITNYSVALAVVYCMLFILICTALQISILSVLRIMTNYTFQGVCFLCHKKFYIKPIIGYFFYCCMRIFFVTIFLLKKIITNTCQLFNSYYIEKTRPQMVSGFDTVAQKEIQDIANNDWWQKHTAQKTEFQVPKVDEIDTHKLQKKDETPFFTKKNISYQLPPLHFFKQDTHRLSDSHLRQEHELMAKILEEKLARFGVQGQVVAIKLGPVITLFEYQPHIDSKLSKIIALEDDLALALQALSIRIIAPIPGKSVVGFEVANKTRSDVLLSSIIYSKEFTHFSGKLPLVLGVDTIGNTLIVDLTAMPHVLIAGSTGSGKSVALNVILLSLLYRCRPDELKLILIDPKRLEFAPYGDIPHLLFPIVTHPKDASPVLQWVVNTMEQRYELMATCGVRNVFDYNKMAALSTELEKLPFIVVMIDELSDLMMVAGKEIEEKIARIAQMARAAGIHLVVATQRPSVDVITGIIKANFPSRISFKIATKIDSRIILDTIGADKLLGKGDMLYLDTSSYLVRAHGAFVSDKEIEQVCNHVRSMQQVVYLDLEKELPQCLGNVQEGDETLYQDVVEYLKTIDEISISALQRKFRIGYNRSARVIEMLESQGMILATAGSKMKKVIH